MTSFSYNDTARIYVSGRPKWINNNFSGAPRGRQDVLETGQLRVELFDSQELETFIREHREALKRLGLNFIH